MGLEVNQFVGSVDSELLCPICRCVYLDPVSNIPNCLHTYCSVCIRKRLRSESSRFCPVCDEPLRENLSKPSLLLQDKLLSLEIVCNQKCGATCKLKDLPGHLERECELTYVNCPYSLRGCKFRMLRKDMKEHLEECDYRWEVCEACGFKTYHCMLFTHQKKRKCMDKKLANEKVRSVIETRKDIRNHQKEVKIDRFANDREIERVERARYELRSISVNGSQDSLSMSGHSRGEILPITNGESGISRTQSAFTLPGVRSTLDMLPLRTTNSARSVGRLPAPSPSRTEDHPLQCRRCRKKFKQSKNHEKACSWHKGVSYIVFH
ncbi:E3 ubiquitin-protein ligase NRDP1-like [Ptychodera flava]|uniref:E3 ubiquitin-protein ligase NRDP1-like n=1 Tax=Ptychodera flava TaxID=63121 RepID=UPI00396A666C